MKIHNFRSFSIFTGTLLLALLFTFIIAGCGTLAGAAGSTGSTATATPAQKCGTIGLMGPNLAHIPSSDSTAGTCFWQAFLQCHAASLTVNFGGVDTVTTHIFSLQKKGSDCAISDAIQHRVIPRPATQAITYTCTSLVKEANELHFNSCGVNGDIVVPMGNS